MKCFYHNDLDGRCAASIVGGLYAGEKHIDFIEVNYMENLTPYLVDILPKEKIYFVDYPFIEKTMWVLEELMKKECDIIWCDHHESSVELEKRYPKLKEISGIRHKEYCSAALIYMYLYNDEHLNRLNTYIENIILYDNNN